MRETESHGLRIPDRGSSDWDQPWAWVVEEIDRRLEIRGPQTTRNDHTPRTGRKFFATDTKNIYTGTGTQWEKVPSSGPNPTFDHASADRLTLLDAPSTQQDAVRQQDIEDFVTESEVQGITGSYAGSEIIVTDPANLQEAVNNNGHVRISGRLDLSAVSPITVPDDVCIEGYGTWRDVDWREYSDSLVDNSANPALILEGNNCRVRGIGIHQQNSGGEALRVTGYSANISEVDIHSEGHGVRCTGPDGTEVPTEPRIYDSRIRSASGGGSGTRGIWIEQQYDSKIIDNIITGFDVNIDIEQDSQFVNGNHSYTHPATTPHTIALRIDARYVRVTDNRFEDAPSDAGVLLVSQGYVLISDNLFQVGDGCDAVRSDHTGETQLTIIKNNLMFAYDDVQGGTVINIDAANGFWRTYIGDNAYYNFANEGSVSVGEGSGMVQHGDDWHNVDYATADHSHTATEDLGTAPTSEPTGTYSAGTLVRNSNADNNETWVLVEGTWVKIGQ